MPHDGGAFDRFCQGVLLFVVVVLFVFVGTVFHLLGLV